MEQLFRDKRVIIMGLGLHGGGTGAAKFFARQGAKVLVTDLKTKKDLKESVDELKRFKGIRYVLGKHRKEDFKKADLIIKNPDVPNNSPYLRFARKHKISIETDISLFFKLADKTFIIGVTGTKGKSTTATLIYKFLKSKYRRTFLAGNIGVSPLELLSKIKMSKISSMPKNPRSWDFWHTGLAELTNKPKVVLELSSFALESLRQSPQLAVITNILPDHLNRYGNIKKYIEAKRRIFRFQNKEDALILNYDDPVVKKFSSKAKSKVYYFSAKEFKNKYNSKKEFNPHIHVVPPVEKKSARNFIYEGEHNLSNVSAAIKVAKLLKVSDKKISKVLKSFKGVPYRQEFIREIKGAKYYNDTTATMPDAVVSAIETFKEKFSKSRLILIAGGQDKNLDYKEMAWEIDKKVDKLVLLPGTASDKIRQAMKETNKIYYVNSMQQAVITAKHLAKKGDIVLLSPGAASFNLFKNEFDRGEQFNKYVKKL